jgi:hypothetical protein
MIVFLEKKKKNLNVGSIVLIITASDKFDFLNHSLG